ncbi:EAL domain-containing protein [Serpentinicella sp. ANB-PHB4]|uniref:sensor domain-containing protein n=1 Tax=Serpentinicella sp. ANB-PHB4 TaxID=3074076 RepID=UPI00285564F1|nr:EAL domain-containing protein [Serpentinicella sp. ANB-PHB4]MDR5659674.1 EAL domain-containing protein [Serpentinicella sp. ANB-PHB4]
MEDLKNKIKQGTNKGFLFRNFNNKCDNKCYDIDPKKEALKTTLIYGALGAMWIIIFELIIAILQQRYNTLTYILTYRGLFHFLVMIIFVYFLLQNRMHLLKSASQNIQKAYSELSATYEKLTVTEEELREQFEESERKQKALIASHQRHDLIVEGSNDGIWEWDEEKQSFYFTLKTKKGLGYSEGDIADSYEAWLELLHPDDKDTAVGNLDRYFKSKDGIYENTYRLKAKDGSYRWILSRGKALRDKKGKIVRIGGSHTDITEQLDLRDNLKREIILSENVINNVSVLIVTWDQNGNIKKFNKFAEKIFGYAEAEVLGENIIDFFTPEAEKPSIYDTYKQIKSGKEVKNLEGQFLTKTGKKVDILWNTSILYRDNEKVEEGISVGTDITERKNMEQKLHTLAYQDDLTGLPNRAQFEVDVKRFIGMKDCFAIVYMDVDNFKYINDTLGHSAGDALLKYLAGTFKKIIHQEDKIFRLGGDEFAIIFGKCVSRQDVEARLEEMIDALRITWVFQGREFFISFSMGTVLFPEHGRDYDILLKKADTAMYYSKEDGKDKFTFYSEEMQEKTVEYIQIVNQLRYAIEKEEFQLYYQPQIDLNTGKVTAVEALIRWMHPVRGLVSPGEFIELAENTGQIHEITEWVLKTACKQKKKWEEKGYPSIKMAINFSGKSFDKMNLANEINTLLNSMEIDRKDIQIEITETAFMLDLDAAVNMVKQIRDIGVKVALDDFGTGYSSLTYLKQLPIDTLKLDREFIRNVKNANEDEVIVKTVIELAHALNMRVVAEGIETEEQLCFLKKYNCDELQGYYFSKPLPGDEVEALLTNEYPVKHCKII